MKLFLRAIINPLPYSMLALFIGDTSFYLFGDFPVFNVFFSIIALFLFLINFNYFYFNSIFFRLFFTILILIYSLNFSYRKIEFSFMEKDPQANC